MHTTLHSSQAPSSGRKIPGLGFRLGLLIAALLMIRWASSFETLGRTTEPIELWLEPGRLTLAPSHLEPSSTLFAEDFRYGASRWMFWTDRNVAGMRGDKDGLVVAPFAGSGIELSGPGGGLSRLSPVEPGSALRFRGSMWVDGIQTTRRGSKPVQGGFLLEEMEHWPLAAALEPRRIAQYAGLRRTLGLPKLERSWAPVDVTIRVGPETNALLVACVLSMDSDLDSGRARFRSLSLERVSLNEHWHRQLREAARRLRTEPGPFFGVLANERLRLQRQSSFPSRAALPSFAHRRVLMGERQAEPGLVLLPQERIKWSLRLPRGVPVLSFHLATWTPSDGMVEGDGLEACVCLRIDGRVLDQWSVYGSQSSLVALPLDGWGGQQIVLELTACGAAPVALARPRIETLRSVQTGGKTSSNDDGSIQATGQATLHPTGSVRR